MVGWSVGRLVGWSVGLSRNAYGLLHSHLHPEFCRENEKKRKRKRKKQKSSNVKRISTCGNGVGKRSIHDG